MPLFHPRVVQKHAKKFQNIPSEHIDILSAWASSLASGAFLRETSHDSEFIQRILIDILGYSGSSAGTNWTIAKNEPVGTGNVDVALGKFSADKSEIFAPFELKGAKTRNLDAIMPGRNKSPVQQAWEYAMDAKGAKWVLVSNYREIRLYAVGYGRKDYERFDLSELTQPENYFRFVLLLSAENLLSDYTFNLLKESDSRDKEITNKLYQDYKDLRSRMINTLSKDNASVPVFHIIQYTQTILDRILFVVFAEYRGLLPKDTLKSCYEDRNKWNPQPVWENFKGLFHSVDKGNPPLKIPGYNGGLFAENKALDSLTLSDELCEGFKTIGSYDFDSDVSVNILGHIFEQSITDLEEIKGNIEGQKTADDKTKSKRKKDGIFYTPPYITRYIVEQAVGTWLNEKKIALGLFDLPEISDEDFALHAIDISSKNFTKKITKEFTSNRQSVAAKIKRHISFWKAYEEVLKNIKILDPACGSGAFLNEVFDYLAREGSQINEQLLELTQNQHSVFRWDTHILANNIYGVDINNESVEITKLSLWLKTANKGEKLTYLDNNIKCGNSLIDDSKVAAALAFKWEREFANIINAGGFDVIVGNPPYGADIDKFTSYIELKYPNTSKAYKDIYKLFFELSLARLIKDNGYLSFITPNTMLLQPRYEDLRTYLLDFRICSIANLGLNVFEGAVVPTCITVIQKRKSKPKELVAYYELASSNQFIGGLDTVAPALTPQSSFSQNANNLFTKAQKQRSKDEFLPISTIMELKDGGIKYQRKDVGLSAKGNNDLAERLFYEGTKIKNNDINFFTGTELSKNGWFVEPQSDHYMRANYKNLLKDNEIVYFNSELFDITPKIIWRQTSPIFIGTLLTENRWFANTIQAAYIKDEYKDKFDIKYLLCLLNSKYLRYLYSAIVQEGGRVFPQVKLTKLKDLPIAIIDTKQQLAFVDRATIMLAKSIELNDISSKFIALVKSDFHLSKLGNKLELWFLHSFNEFCEELAKRKVNLALGRKAEWMTYFEKQKALASKIKLSIDTIENEINQLVYKLYGLTPEEINEIERAIR